MATLLEMVKDSYVYKIVHWKLSALRKGMFPHHMFS